MLSLLFLFTAIHYYSLSYPLPFNHPLHQPVFPFCSPSSHLPTSSELLQEQASNRRREHLVREAIVGKSPGVYSQLIKRFIISSTHFTALQMLNFKWALLAGPNWFNWRTRPNCVLMVCFCLLFDLEDEVADAQLI